MAHDGYRITPQREAADVVRVQLTGEFDIDNAPQLTDALLRAVETAGVALVVVDMGGTTFLDSSAIRAIATGYEAALDADKVLCLVNMQHHVRRLFEILEMTVLFQQR